MDRFGRCLVFSLALPSVALPPAGAVLAAQAQAPAFALESEVRVHTGTRGLDTTAWYGVRPTESPSGCPELALVGMRWMGGRFVVDSGASSTKWARIDYALVLRAQTRAADTLPWREVDRYWIQTQGPAEGCEESFGFYYGGGIGLGGARARSGDAANHTFGMILHARVGWRAFLLDVEWHPYILEYPPTGWGGIPDGLGFSALDVMPSYQFTTGKGYYVQGGIGLQFRHWNYDSDQLSGSVLVGGASVGRSFPLSPTLTIAPEIVGRYAVVSESPVLEEATFVGVRAVLTYSRAPK